jgi:membrane protein implicated in regulation of membrane protease activity
VLGILAIMLVPLPPMLLDMLLAISIILSILVLMTALMIKKPLEFTAFPSVLLLATLLPPRAQHRLHAPYPRQRPERRARGRRSHRRVRATS